MKKWLKRLDISTSLQLSLIISALFCLFIGAVGLYTWHQQRIEIDLAIDQNFPKIQAAFRMEEQINLLENTLLNANNIRNTEEKIKWFNALQKQIKTLKDMTQSLNEDLNDEISTIVIEQANLLQELSLNIDNQLILNTKFNKTLSEINWLHNDFRDEFTALLQEIVWQQTTLANHLTDNLTRSKQIEQLREFQHELLLLYDFLTYEEQIVTELKQHIVSRSDYSLVALTNSLNYLKNLIDQKVKSLDKHTSSYTIKQIIESLLAIGENEQSLPHLLVERKQLDISQRQLMNESELVISKLRRKINSQIGDNQKQLELFHYLINKSTRINGLIILSAVLFVFLFVAAINFYYIRRRLIGRFQSLNQSVERLINGESSVKISVYGNDELGRIAKLLRLFLFEVNTKNEELERRNQILLNEISERIAIQEKLINTQQELIQAAKLAVVGQTLTSISHEITQPLNAMNAYIFSTKRAVKNNDVFSANNYLEKIENLVERTALVVKRLRHFSRQTTNTLQKINLLMCINNAWDLLEPKHKYLNARLSLPTDLPDALGDEILLEQVFVNIFLNSLEAMQHEKPEIEIKIQNISDQRVELWVSDNGSGWPLSDKLLQPFSSSKSINLGLGLSISLSIMQQCQGNLLIASTLTKNALVILEFKVVDNV
ncbi:ATP-binding protein [Aggregatibacter actinomycetemcomitans]|uniref:ATP-binding protein n=4 Tax=Aggregatibacter actinomycetemcomitans TaxID=714 RepID=UPI0011D93D01|nr:ATP-binding protein [Aggregatibacter actinomycetemcomitans]TYA29024.1 histidine kinase [Aggregatibacter actinomycetemcomitans]TYA42894.1 histidine kinase [Aggregatibacter actinomycetemcomitans]TYB01266.1 histidine kinase [Aggregatibacter actinomycetemcomitans]TYB11049.1 histidine kinase [Aggregatibacter actinomycetemcomitans]TYB20720.1 histidine kinase [Aggregatibacter actinomycetemcomitans]